MGTFHQDKGELHGITVAVDTTGGVIYVGRCDQVLPEGVVLLDGAAHEDGEAGVSNVDWLARAARYGVFKTFDRLLVPTAKVASIRRLGDL